MKKFFGMLILIIAVLVSTFVLVGLIMSLVHGVTLVAEWQSWFSAIGNWFTTTFTPVGNWFAAGWKNISNWFAGLNKRG